MSVDTKKEEKPIKKITITEFLAGENHALEMTNEGDIYSWGKNQKGQCGLGSGIETHLIPKKIQSINKFHINNEKIIKVCSGHNHNVLLTNQGSLYGWGDNTFKQCGIKKGNSIDTPTKIDFNKEEEITELFTNSSTNFVMTKTGAIYSWGQNISGQCGIGKSSLSVLKPTKMDFDGKLIKQICSGLSHSIALTKSGTLYSWGFNNSFQCGKDQDLLSPTKIPFDVVFKSISVGLEHNLALTGQGEVYCWGSNKEGQCGLGTTDEFIKIPTRIVFNNEEIVKVVAGGLHSLALTKKGNVYCWGSNEYGQCGKGYEKLLLVPTKIDLSDIHQLVAGSFFNLALSRDGIQYGWGLNSNGQCHLGLYDNQVRLPLDGFNDFITACYQGNTTYVNAALDESPDILNFYDEFCLPPLCAAICSNNLQMAKLLIKHKVDVNAELMDLKTPLILAIEYGDFDMVHLLIKHHAKVNPMASSGSPLLTAILCSNLPIIKLLLENQADVSLMDRSGSIPLFSALSVNSKEIIDLLIQYKADVDSLDIHGKTCLFRACEENNVDMVRHFLSHDANVHMVDKYGGHALFATLTSPMFDYESIFG